MGKNAAGAFALILLWIGLVCYFVALHPGGISVNEHPAQNPRDVILWLMQRLATGTPASQSGGEPVLRHGGQQPSAV